MELQISHSICTKISKKSFLWRKAGRNRKDIADTVRLEKDKDRRGRGMPRSRTYVGRDTTKVFGIKFHGVKMGLTFNYP